MTVLAPDHETQATRITVSRPTGLLRPGADSNRAPDVRRRDIQGLRALAVAAVVGDHMLGKPSGGFLGVDIFFTISGFLITGLLLREFGRSGRIDLLNFYRRRLKRTVPVAWLVLLVTLVVGALILSVYRVDQLVSAVISAGTFWINWQLIALGADYLHATDTPTAVQHYWSLAVEEQFYLVWPLILLLALGLGRRMPRGGLLIAPASLVVLLGLSVFWAAHETSAQPTAAYFSTFTRGWELLAGALLAFCTPALRKIPNLVRPWLAWSGLALLTFGLTTVTVDSPFPYPWALVAVVGTGLIIAAGTGGLDTQIWPLTNQVSQYVGSISYSVYLWHFPVVIFAGVFHPEAGRIIAGLELLLIVLLSVLSYHLVEVPFRQHSWRRPRLGRPRRGALAAVACATAGVLLLSITIVQSKHPTQVTAAFPVKSFFTKKPTPAQEARSGLIRAALTARTWPALTPSDRELGEGARVPEWTRDGCLNGFGPAKTAERCVFGDRDAARTVVLYGDSVALSYLPGLRAALDGRGWRIEALTDGQCPAVDVSVVVGDGTPYAACDEYHDFALKRIASERPDLVIMTSSYLSLDRLASGNRDRLAGAEWATATRRTVDRIGKSATHVVLLDAPPIEASPQSCKTGISAPTDCVAGVQGNWLNAAESQRVGIDTAKLRNVSAPSTLPWFCDEAGRCPSFVDGVVTLADGMHLTDQGSRQLAPLIREAVVGATR